MSICRRKCEQLSSILDLLKIKLFFFKFFVFSFSFVFCSLEWSTQEMVFQLSGFLRFGYFTMFLSLWVLEWNRLLRVAVCFKKKKICSSAKTLFLDSYIWGKRATEGISVSFSSPLICLYLSSPQEET